MGMRFNRVVAIALGAALGAASLGGCSKKVEQAAVYTLNGTEVDSDLTNFLFRFQQAQFEQSYGQFFAQLYGSSNIWEMDMTGNGMPYGVTFKEQFGTFMEQTLLDEEHAADLGVEITDEDKAAISEAADKFMAANSEDALKSMSASKEIVERALTLYTIRNRVEEKIGEGADTEVSDEEAAQRTVSYIEYVPTVPEEETEVETEADFENTTEADEELTAAAMTEAEEKMEADTEADDSKASADGEATTQTEGSDKTGAGETEADTEEDTEIELIFEEEEETEDPAMAAAKEEYLAMAEAELKKIQDEGMSFADAMAEASGSAPGVSTSSLTFGEDDEYTDAAIIEATNGLADDTLVDHIVEANGAYYILHVDYALDRDATDAEKKNIVDERKSTLVSETYDGWVKDAEWNVNTEALADIVYDVTYTAPATTSGVEDLIQDVLSETELEGSSEAMTEAEEAGSASAAASSVSETETEAE